MGGDGWFSLAVGVSGQLQLLMFAYNNCPFEPHFPLIFWGWLFVVLTSKWSYCSINSIMLLVTGSSCLLSSPVFNDWSKCQHMSRLQSKSRRPLLFVKKKITRSVCGTSVLWIFLDEIIFFSLNCNVFLIAGQTGWI